MKGNGKRLLIILMVLVGSTIIFFGYKKEGYHVDEVYSYGLANSEYLPFMHFGESGYDVKDWMMDYGAGESLADLLYNLVNDFKILKECDFKWRESVIYRDYLIAQANSADTRTTTWLTGQDYLDYIAVSESNTFNYASVYYNQRGDVHPPLYYIILHTVCSIFQGSFSKWFGLGINLILMMLILTVMYQMIKVHFGGEWVALATIMAYGLSRGCISNAMYVRMYVLLELAMLCFCYVHLHIAGKDFSIKGRSRWLLILAAIGGFLTHYYFVLYAVFVAATYMVWMICLKKWKPLFQYFLTLVCSAVFGLCIWPFAIRHVFEGYRGQEALGNLLYEDYSSYRMQAIWQQSLDAIFGGRVWVFAAATVLLAVAVLLWRKKEISVWKILMIGLPVAAYFTIVTQIVPFLAERYVMSSYPFWCLFVVGSVYAFIKGILYLKEEGKLPPIIRKVGREKIVSAVVVLSGVGLLMLNNCFMNAPDYVTTGSQETVEFPENTDYVFVMPDNDWNQSAVDSTILAKARRVGVAYQSNVKVLKEDYDYQAGDYLMIAVQKDMDVEAVLADVKATLEVEHLQEISRSLGSTSVRILLGMEQ